MPLQLIGLARTRGDAPTNANLECSGMQKHAGQDGNQPPFGPCCPEIVHMV